MLAKRLSVTAKSAAARQITMCSQCPIRVECIEARQHTAYAAAPCSSVPAGKEQLLDMTLISTEAVLKRKHLDAGRHVPAPRRYTMPGSS